MLNFTMKYGKTVPILLALWAATALFVTGSLFLPLQTPLQRASSASVEISTEVASEDGGLTPDGSGSGTVVDPRGYILTCWHVVKGAAHITVEWDGIHAVAHLVARSEDLDLAIIKVDREMTHVCRWGNSDSLVQGDEVIAIGYPFDVARLVRRGVIAGLNYNIDDNPYLITDTQINPGDSGGGLYTPDGCLIGIPARIYCRQGLAANIGIAFAIPGNIAHTYILNNLPAVE